MRQYNLLRRDYVNSWKISNVANSLAYFFPLEKELQKRLSGIGYDLFLPIKVKAIEDKDYNIKLSYLIDALAQLPRAMDIAFDFIWRGYEKSLKDIYPNDNITKQVQKETIAYGSDPDIVMIAKEFIEILPMQTWEFVVKSFKDSWNPSVNMNSQKGLIKRTFYIGNRSNEQVNLINMYNSFGNKYFTNYNAKEHRNAACFFKRYFKGQTMSIGSDSYRTNDLEKCIILFNCLLYEFRNTRTHAVAISPFKSSKATISTFMHCHIVFLITYACFLFSGLMRYGIKKADIIDNIKMNIDSFKKFYGKAINK